MPESRSSLIQQTIGAGLVVLLVLSAIGYTAVERSLRKYATRQVTPEGLARFVEVYQNYFNEYGRSPSGIADMIDYDDRTGRPTPNNVYALVAEGHIQVVWNGWIGGPEFNEQHMVAWETIAPTQGGLALMADGSTRSVTIVEFEELSKLPLMQQ